MRTADRGRRCTARSHRRRTKEIARRGREVALVEHEAAGHALDAGLAELVDEIDQLFGHELRIAGALDVQVALQRAVRVDRAVRVGSRAPAVVGPRIDRPEGRRASSSSRHHRPARIPRSAAPDRRRARRRRSSPTPAPSRAAAHGRRQPRARQAHDGRLACFLVGFLAGLRRRCEGEGRAGGDDGGRLQANAGAGANRVERSEIGMSEYGEARRSGRARAQNIAETSPDSPLQSAFLLHCTVPRARFAALQWSACLTRPMDACPDADSACRR